MTDYRPLGVVLVVLGLGLAVWPVLYRLRAIRHWLNGVTTEAVVLSSRLLWYGGDSNAHWTKVRFTVRYGLEVSARVVTYTKMMAGNRISIVYNPDKPERAALLSTVQEMHLERGLWRLPWWAWLALVLSIPFVIIGLLTATGRFP